MNTKEIYNDILDYGELFDFGEQIESMMDSGNGYLDGIPRDSHGEITGYFEVTIKWRKGHGTNT